MKNFKEHNILLKGQMLKKSSLKTIMNFLSSKITISIVNKFKRQLIINQYLSKKYVDIKGGKMFYSQIFFGLKLFSSS